MATDNSLRFQSNLWKEWFVSSLSMNKAWMKQASTKMESSRSFWRKQYPKCLILLSACSRYVDLSGLELHVLKGFEDALYIFLQSSKIKKFYVLSFFLKIVYENLNTKFGMAFYDQFKDYLTDKALPILFCTFKFFFGRFLISLRKNVEKQYFSPFNVSWQKKVEVVD